MKRRSWFRCPKVMGGPLIASDPQDLEVYIPCRRARFHLGGHDSGWVPMAAKVKFRKRGGRVLFDGVIA